MKKILIFGGTGFLGNSIADYLKEKDYQCILIGRNRPKKVMDHDFIQWMPRH